MEQGNDFRRNRTPIADSIRAGAGVAAVGKDGPACAAVRELRT